MMVCAWVPAHSADQPKRDVDARVAEAHAIIEDFMSRLKDELQRALKEVGPEGAIRVCKKAAPDVTSDVAEAHGWDVGRTALKLRNPDNKPDAWERQVLEDFVKRTREGANPKTLSATRIDSADGETVFRYMKAIPLAKKPCATCHGTNVDPDLRAEILERYPQDKAVGFKPGEIRGAFTLSRRID
jgi:hypothetical protein